MKILHISDLHYKESTDDKYDIKKIVKKIVDGCSGQEIKFVFFTGDLVFSGEKFNDFLSVKNLVLDELHSKLSIPKENILFVCGNHDVHRGQEMSVITENLKNLTSEESLNIFLKDSKQFEASLVNSANYIAFQKQYINDRACSDENTDQIEKLYTIHTRKIDNNNVHIVTINTAWRSNDSKTDEGNLLYPTKFLKEAISKLPQNDFKILLLHHPLTDLRYWNRTLVEDLICSNFHIMFSGHIHRSISAAITKSSDGIVSFTSDAALSNINKYEHIGFSILDISIDDLEIKNQRFRIDSDHTLYPYGTSQTVNIPIADDKRQIIDFRRKISALYEIEFSKAKELFVSYNQDFNRIDDLFAEPVLKTASATSISSVAKKSVTAKVVGMKDILQSNKNNYVIYGKDKFGKSSILSYLNVSYLENPSNYKTLPLYIDCGSKKNKTSDINEIFAQTYQVNKSFLENIIKTYTLRLLLDDYNKVDDAFKRKIENFLLENKNVSYVATSDENILSDFEEIKIDSTEHSKLYIHSLTKKQVKNITIKSLNCSQEKAAEIIIKIRSVFRQLNMPLNYWTVSLFLWIFSNTSEQKFHNNFELIQLYIDNLLDKEGIIMDSSIKFEYESLKTFLGISDFFGEKSQ